jgi:peptidyl-prolyl cis-trans isomerase B (cyclophilin B)
MTARLLTTLFISVSAVYSCLAQDTGATPKKANARPAPNATKVPKAEPFDNADVKTMAERCVRLETELGNIEIEVYPEQAPETVRNFLNLAATGMYDTTTFNRVVPNFVIQGGKLSTRESGITAEIETRSERTIPDEPNKILHQRGVVSMAHSGEPHSASTQFFIVVSEASYLDGRYSAFGRVTSGMNVVDDINRRPIINERPDKPVRLKKAVLFTCSAR